MTVVFEEVLVVFGVHTADRRLDIPRHVIVNQSLVPHPPFRGPAVQAESETGNLTTIEIPGGLVKPLL
jgi:hypothetical protein